MAEELRLAGHDGGLARFTKDLRTLIILPPDKRDRPDERLVKQANKLRGWTL